MVLFRPRVSIYKFYDAMSSDKYLSIGDVLENLRGQGCKITDGLEGDIGLNLRTLERMGKVESIWTYAGGETTLSLSSENYVRAYKKTASAPLHLPDWIFNGWQYEIGSAIRMSEF